MYNVLEALREGRALTAKEQAIHDAGLVSILRQLHNDLDAAVFAAYGWSDLWQMQQDAKAGAFRDFKTGATAQAAADPSAFAAMESEFQRAWEQELLTRLVALNAQRATEEANGQIRYLRPEYQRPKDEGGKAKESQTTLEIPAKENSKCEMRNAKLPKRAWPKSLADRVRLIDETLRTTPGPHTSTTLAKLFARANEEDVTEILETLAALGRATKSTDCFASQ